MSKRLGMGIDALLGQIDEAPPPSTKIALSQIDSDPAQPRKYFDEETLAELATSIKNNGIIQPLVVQPQGGRYLIIAGERRYRAALQAGLTEVDVVIKDFTEQQRLEVALLENIQREDLKPIEEAEAYQQLLTKLNLTQQQLATRLGKSRSVIANALRLLELPENIQHATETGQLSASHARTLAGLSQPSLQQNLYNQIKKEKLTVRETEQRVSTLKPTEALANPLPALEKQTGFKQIKIKGTENKGVIELGYTSKQELQQIIALLSKK